jgi:ectoine hydroxylase-related dioxygenase (phytanoyl-CoA dioxygenase family)
VNVQIEFILVGLTLLAVAVFHRHTLSVALGDTERIVSLPVRRGSITVHNERIVHGSGGNRTDGWRRTYVIAHRSRATVAYERRIGFTHSHNDKINWQTELEALELNSAD